MIEVDSLRAGYVPGIDILNGCTATFEEGNISSIIGPNGAGKSTLLKTLYGFVDPHQGTIQYRGEDLTKYDPTEMINECGIAYIPQERSVFPDLTIQENFELGAWVIRKDAERTQERIEAAFDEFPALKAKRHQRAGALSGGQQRMLEVARSLITDPDVVLIDEPSVGLAPDLTRGVYDSIHKLREQGVTIMLVDQNIEAAVKYGDELFILERGEIVTNEPTTEMTEDIEALVSEWISAKGGVA